MTSSITVWYGRATQKDIKSLTNVITQAEKIICVELPSLETVYKNRLNRKASIILKDESHPANKPSGRRYRHFKGNKRFLDSTYPQTVKLLNSKL